jgi:hypothetical protein
MQILGVTSFEVSENSVHKPLKDCRCIGQPKRHDIRLIQSERSFESHYPTAFGFDPDIIIAIPDIKLSYETSPM